MVIQSTLMFCCQNEVEKLKTAKKDNLPKDEYLTICCHHFGTDKHKKKIKAAVFRVLRF